MKRLHFAATIAGTLGAITATLIACSSDDTVIIQPDGGPDATPDVTTPDVITPTDAGQDVTDPDGGFLPDASQLQLAEIICETVARCCFGDSTLGQGGALDGGGTFNRTKCLDTYRENGFESSNPGPKASVSRINLNQAKATECGQKIRALSCQLTYPELQSARTACYAAQVGTQAAGQPCNVGECAPGTFCNNTDGGGVCETIRVNDAGCGFRDDPAIAQHACSNRYSGDPARYCEFYDTVNDVTFPTNQWFCKTPRPNPELCLNSAWCGAGACNPENNQCGSPVNYFPSTLCTTFKTP
jgi:hypothetical protein